MNGLFTNGAEFSMCMKGSDKHKVHAFTLSEVIVTMVVSSLVILLAYSVFTMVNGYFRRCTVQNDLYAERLIVRTLLSNDVNRCDSLKLSNGELQVFQMMDTIIWESKMDTLKRQYVGGIKSFVVGHHSLKYHQEEFAFNQLKVLFQNGEVDSLEFSFVKQYDLADLINDSTWQSP